MVVVGLMSIVGLSITSVMTNTSKSQKRLEQKDIQLGTANLVRSVLQNPNFCANAFCEGDVATCAATNLSGLPRTGNTGTIAEKPIYAIQMLGPSLAAQQIVRCAAGSNCNVLAAAAEPPVTPQFGSPVPSSNGIYIYGMRLMNIVFLGELPASTNNSSATLVIKYATDPKLTAGGKLKDTIIPIVIRANGAGTITGCTAGAADSKWLDSPTIPSGIYYDGPVGIGTTSPIVKLQVESNATTNEIRMNGTTSSMRFLNYLDGTNWIQSGTDFSAGSSSDLNFSNISATQINMTIKAGGNVGIGTTAPSAKLHLVDGGTAADSTFNANGRIKFRGDGVINWGPAADAGLLSWLANLAIVGSLVGNNLALYSNGVEQMRIDTAGNVGIGQTAPSAKLDVTGNIRLSGAATRSISTESGNSLLLHAPGAAAVIIRNNVTDSLSIASNSAATFSNSVTIATGGLTVTTGGATISAGGANIVGNSRVTGDLRVTANLDVTAATIPILNGNIQHNGNLTGNGGDISNYNNYLTSDRRYKRDLVPLQDQNSNLEQLGVYTFKYLNDPKNREHIGLIAQEVQKFYPQLVLQTEDGKLNLNYVELIPVTIKALQESNAEIKRLKLINQKFVEENEKLGIKVNQLEQQQSKTSEQIKNIMIHLDRKTQ